MSTMPVIDSRIESDIYVDAALMHFGCCVNLHFLMCQYRYDDPESPLPKFQANGRALIGRVEEFLYCHSQQNQHSPLQQHMLFAIVLTYAKHTSASDACEARSVWARSEPRIVITELCKVIGCYGRGAGQENEAFVNQLTSCSNHEQAAVAEFVFTNPVIAC